MSGLLHERIITFPIFDGLRPLRSMRKQHTKPQISRSSLWCNPRRSTS